MYGYPGRLGHKFRFVCLLIVCFIAPSTGVIHYHGLGHIWLQLSVNFYNLGALIIKYVHVFFSVSFTASHVVLLLRSAPNAVNSNAGSGFFLDALAGGWLDSFVQDSPSRVRTGPGTVPRFLFVCFSLTVPHSAHVTLCRSVPSAVSVSQLGLVCR